jgi:hypothetical protein
MHFEDRRKYIGNDREWLLDGLYFGKIFFIRHDQPILNTLAFDGQIPEDLIDDYIGEHPDRLIEGFSTSKKPADSYEWMNDSHIEAIFHHNGTVLVELGPS